MFKLRISKERTSFAAAHFITYEGGQSELLHGHNYRVTTVIEGDLTEHAYVMDFSLLKRLVESTCKRLDHRMLIPLRNGRLTVVNDNNSVTVKFGAKRYVFPVEDVAFLPVANTTCEELARWIGEELLGGLAAEAVQYSLRTVEVEVEESPGQSAIWTYRSDWTLRNGATSRQQVYETV